MGAYVVIHDTALVSIVESTIYLAWFKAWLAAAKLIFPCLIRHTSTCSLAVKMRCYARLVGPLGLAIC